MIGRLENSIAFNDGLISMLHASRHVRDVLQAKGYNLTLSETNGGHDPYNWEAALPDALIALLNEPTHSKRVRIALPEPTDYEASFGRTLYPVSGAREGRDVLLDLIKKRAGSTRTEMSCRPR